jgi:predicted nucleic acid-binding protein
VLAQAWRGEPQTSLSWLLSGCQVEDMDEPRARAAGALCGAAGTGDVVDAMVVAGAVARQDAVLTSDPRDLDRLAAALGTRLEIHRL